VPALDALWTELPTPKTVFAGVMTPICHYRRGRRATKRFSLAVLIDGALEEPPPLHLRSGAVPSSIADDAKDRAECELRAAGVLGEALEAADVGEQLWRQQPACIGIGDGEQRGTVSSVVVVIDAPSGLWI
jgi:hypothetical protein